MSASKTQSSAAAAADFWVFNFGSKILHFADWPFPESAAAKLDKSKILFHTLDIVIIASAKYTIAKYKNMIVHMYHWSFN